MSFTKFFRVIAWCISIYIIIVVAFFTYEFVLIRNANNSIDTVLPVGEYTNANEVLSGIKPNESTNDHRYFHPELIRKLNNEYGGFNYEYSLSGVRGLHYLRRSDDGSIHRMIIWPQTVLTKNEIYFVRDVDSLIVALNNSFPLFLKEFHIFSPNDKPFTYDEIDNAVRHADSIMINNSSVLLSKEDCSDSYAIPIDMGDYRFIYEGQCRHKKIAMLDPSFYKIKSRTLSILAICALVIIFFLFIVSLQNAINHRRANKPVSIKDTNEEHPSIKIEIHSVPKLYCKFCGKEIDADSKFCSHCGISQSD